MTPRQPQPRKALYSLGVSRTPVFFFSAGPSRDPSPMDKVHFAAVGTGFHDSPSGAWHEPHSTPPLAFLS